MSKMNQAAEVLERALQDGTNQSPDLTGCNVEYFRGVLAKARQAGGIETGSSLEFHLGGYIEKVIAGGVAADPDIRTCIEEIIEALCPGDHFLRPFASLVRETEKLRTLSDSFEDVDPKWADHNMQINQLMQSRGFVKVALARCEAVQAEDPVNTDAYNDIERKAGARIDAMSTEMISSSTASLKTLLGDIRMKAKGTQDGSSWRAGVPDDAKLAAVLDVYVGSSMKADGNKLFEELCASADNAFAKHKEIENVFEAKGDGALKDNYQDTVTETKATLCEMLICQLVLSDRLTDAKRKITQGIKKKLNKPKGAWENTSMQPSALRLTRWSLSNPRMVEARRIAFDGVCLHILCFPIRHETFSSSGNLNRKVPCCRHLLRN